MAKFFITYGGGTIQRDSFSIIEAEDYPAARQLLRDTISDKFAFCYSEAEFAGQAERYGLKEIPLIAQARAS
jgi:hypothetical protein